MIQIDKIAPITLTFLLCIVLIRCLQPLAHKLRWVDVPGGRKTHRGDIPLVGGVAMVSSFLFVAIIFANNAQDYSMLLLGSLLLAFIGFLDDRQDISAKLRLVVQLIAVLLMAVVANIKLVNLGDILFLGGVHLGLISLPLTLFAALSLINAVNMTDGLDGLAGSLSLVSFTSMSFLSHYHHGFSDNSLFLNLYISCISAFLLFNLRLPHRQSAAVFMGDAGSLFLGFGLVWFSISLSQSNSAVIRPVTMLWLMSIPLYDLMTVFIRRIKNNTSPLQPGRDHIHHVLQDIGLSVNQTLITMILIASTTAIIGIIGEIVQINASLMFVSFILIYIVYIVCINESVKYIDNQAFTDHRDC